MSMMRCDKHDRFFDSDFVEECVECENEQAEQDEIQEDTTSMEEKLEALETLQ